MKTPRLRTVLFSVLLVAVAVQVLPVLLLGAPLVYRVGDEYVGRTSFTSSAWQDSARVFSQEPVRIRMIDDLLERHDLGTMDREAVVSLLGEPDETPYFRNWDMVYWLGPQRGLIRIDSEWLVLRLDERQQVVEHRIVTD